MHTSTILLLTHLLSTLALPTSQPTPGLTIKTYPLASCKGTPSTHPDTASYELFEEDVPIRSYRLSKDLKPTDQLMFMDVVVEGDDKKEGCHDLGIEALNFVLRSTATALMNSAVDGGP